MCGIFGIVSPNQTIDRSICAKAHAVQAHRGPDSKGDEVYAVGQCNVLLGHQRLAILDLSAAGHQPMARPAGDGVLVYNGELYNYLELRQELSRIGESFSTATDTEVVLSALHRWSLKKALRSFNWMGAVAWLDLTRKRLVLARDIGAEKPLYVTKVDGKIYFASEIKTVLTLVGRRFSLSPQVVGEYLLQSQSDRTSATVFDRIWQLEPGHYVEIPLAEDSKEELVSLSYWSHEEVRDSDLTLTEFVEELRQTFRDAVRIRLRSDVPVGVLLSGGIDSSSIAAICDDLNGKEQPLNLLSAVSDDDRFDESPFIDAMAKHLDRPVNKVRIDADSSRLFDDLATVSWHNDQPVGSFSNVAHYRLMEKAKSFDITVVLSGQGADELLLGYRKYLGFYLQWLVRNRRPLKALSTLAEFTLNRSIVSQIDLSEAKRYLSTNTRKYLLRNDIDIRGAFLKGYRQIDLGLGQGTVNLRQWQDIRHCSVPSLCHWEDRMSMANSREIRLPFLDRRLIELLLATPPEYKLRKGWTKYGFRKAMEPWLPKEVVWRRDKQGFVNPQGEWLKTELRSKVMEAFSEDSMIFHYEIIDRSRLLKKYDAYCKQRAGKGGVSFSEIFAPLALEVWMKQYAEWIR